MSVFKYQTKCFKYFFKYSTVTKKHAYAFDNRDLQANYQVNVHWSAVANYHPNKIKLKYIMRAIMPIKHYSTTSRQQRSVN
jgi:hypothetical protein